LYATAKTAFPASPLPSLTAAPLLAFPGAMRSAKIIFFDFPDSLYLSANIHIANPLFQVFPDG